MNASEIRCTGCSSKVNSLNRFTVQLKAVQHRFCSHCNQTHEDAMRPWHFCSALCLLKHLRACLGCGGAGCNTVVMGEDMSREDVGCTRCNGIGLEIHR